MASINATFCIAGKRNPLHAIDKEQPKKQPYVKNVEYNLFKILFLLPT